MRRIVTIALLTGCGVALAQAPNEIWGAIYNLVAPTLSDKQAAPFQSTVNGRLDVTGLTPPAGCTGAIDLSEGCTLTIAIGLGP